MSLTKEQRELAENNHNLIYAYLHKKHLPIEEWYGVAAIGLTEAARDYDKKRGVPFASYAFRVMGNHIKDKFDYAKAQKRDEDGRKLSLDTVVVEEEGNTYMEFLVASDSTEDIVFTKLNFENLINALTGKTRRVLILALLGYSTTETSKEMNCTERTVLRMKQEIAHYKRAVWGY